MIKSFLFENFKSFEKAELELERMTSLIGANSSGKSNAIEGIRILSESATGVDLSVVLDGTRSRGSHIRGGSSACCRFKTFSFKLGCLVDLDENYDLLYYIRISTNRKVQIEEESLYKVQNARTNFSGGERIFKTKAAGRENDDIYVSYNNKKRGKNPDIVCRREASILAQLKNKLPQNTDRDAECLRYVNIVLDDLKKIFVLNPVPGDMRDYVRLTDTEMKENAENISAVLYKLCQDEQKKKNFLDVICSLPENEVKGIEFVKTQLDDVIFGLKERYIGTSELVDAKKLSDGTLRCIAITAAVLSSAKNAVLIIEEIDNGIHPGRINALLNSLQKLADRRGIDIIITTHNPVVLNQYDKNSLLGTSVVYRDLEKGTSRFIPVVDIDDYPKILAEGLGNAMENDSLIKAIKEYRKTVDCSWLGV